MNFCSWKDRKAVAADLRPIHEAPTAEEAARRLDAFEEKWAGKYPPIAPAWRRAWAEVTPFHAFSAAIRKIICTTNAVESLNRVLRKTLKTKGAFPTEEAATKLIFLAIRNFEKGGRALIARTNAAWLIEKSGHLSPHGQRRIHDLAVQPMAAQPDRVSQEPGPVQ